MTVQWHGILLVVLAESEAVPSNGLVVRGDLDASPKKRLLEALLTMHESPAGSNALESFGSLRFIATGTAEYEPDASSPTQSW
jgi:ABC-type phosphate/phosphonate transport system substrate-binding protein